MRHGIISSCRSAATSEIVKRCCSNLRKQRYSKYPDLYLYLFTFNAVYIFIFIHHNVRTTATLCLVSGLGAWRRRRRFFGMKSFDVKRPYFRL